MNEIEKLEEQKSKWDNACKGHLERRIEVLEENIKLSNQIKELEKNFELSAHSHNIEINKLLESVKFSDQSFREMEELFRSENKRVKELELELSDAIKAGTPYWKERDLMNSYVVDNARLREALEKIADPRKRDHKEPDAYTELGCVMNIASEALRDTQQITNSSCSQEASAAAIDQYMAPKATSRKVAHEGAAADSTQSVQEYCANCEGWGKLSLKGRPSKWGTEACEVCSGSGEPKQAAQGVDEK